jgi:hypothetical protein
VKPVELFITSLAHLAAKLPMWARLLLGLWIWVAGGIGFGFVQLPIENAWLRIIVLAPAAFILLMVLAQMSASMASWVVWPFRKAATFFRKAH